MAKDTQDAAADIINSADLCSNGLDLTGIVFRVRVSATYALNLYCFSLILEITDMMIHVNGYYVDRWIFIENTECNSSFRHHKE